MQLQVLTGEQTLSNDSYQLTQDQTAVHGGSGHLVNAVKADDTSMVGGAETRLVSDRAAVVTAKTNRTNTLGG